MSNTKRCRKPLQKEGVKVTQYCRDAILSRAVPEPELVDVSGVPTWLLHFLLFVTQEQVAVCVAGGVAYCLADLLCRRSLLDTGSGWTSADAVE